MTAKLDLVIVGSGPGGMAAGILAKQKNLSYIILEKGHNPMQGIIDTYPKGKKVYPTIPQKIHPALSSGRGPAARGTDSRGSLH